MSDADRVAARWALLIDDPLFELRLAGEVAPASSGFSFGPLPEHHGRIRDLGTLELVNGVGLVSLIVLLGVLPATLMDSINFSVITLLTRGGG